MLRRASLRRAVLGLGTVLSLAACKSSTEPGQPPTELTSLPRQLTSGEQQLIAASNGFSFALWHQLSTAQRDSNVFISPLSASFALGMTLTGAASTSFDQMRAALQLSSMPLQDIDAGYRSLVALLTSLDPSVTIRIANSVWYSRDFPVEQSFLQDVRSYFGAEVQGLDFSDDAGSLKTINGWVDQKTNGKIPSVLDAIDPRNVMFLIDALYFKGSWRTRFDASRTTDDVFTTSSGVRQPMRLMHRHDSMLYAATPTYQAVDLPYGNGAYSMTVVLPRPDTDIEALSADLSGSSWDALVGSLHGTDVDLSLPKVRLSYERLLNDDLKALGMVAPFGAGADFSRMSPLGRQLYIDFVKQNTFLDVDEEGTEAAAATTVGISVTSLPVTSVMRVDHPFLFVIRERLSGTVLFMGKIVRLPDA